MLIYDGHIHLPLKQVYNVRKYQKYNYFRRNANVSQVPFLQLI